MSEKLVDLAGIQDTFSCGSGRIEAVGPCARVTFFVDQNEQRIVVDKVMMPREALADMARQIIDFLAEPTAKLTVVK